MTGYSLFWWGRGFGEPLIISLFTNILNDNNINAVFHQHRFTKNLIDCPLLDLSENSNHKNFIKYRVDYKLIDVPVILQYIEQAEQIIGKKIKLTRNHVPVLYYDIPEIPKVDIIMNTLTGTFTPYKNWPYFNELKNLFKVHNLSYIDLNEEKIYGIECLNYVKKAKLYLGLDTGTSHYVSQFANGKALILLGGFTPVNFQFYLYDYDLLYIDIFCRPCWLNKESVSQGMICQNDYKCMKELSVEKVFKAVKKKIEKNN